MHISIQEGRSLPDFQQCATCCEDFHCPFCASNVFHPAKSSKVQTLESHFTVAVISMKLPEGIIRRILRFVVLEDGDPAICTLALTCKNLNYIVSQGSFQKEAHFNWLDSKFIKCLYFCLLLS
ncbi:7-carboxy-7-deazaguanine synthase [Dissostichus eleginoides]|uniref:7-carboxy-7-deazaguanine synthase n=1 Tax=Dissostichus eleginoides TaxID=100907 RepID=A0AAD9BVP3_DISEL|nr:7-carboxy-7-deazaguanine synthase [Dissostichus eleginoides]